MVRPRCGTGGILREGRSWDVREPREAGLGTKIPDTPEGKIKHSVRMRMSQGRSAGWGLGVWAHGTDTEGHMHGDLWREEIFGVSESVHDRVFMVCGGGLWPTGCVRDGGSG